MVITIVKRYLRKLLFHQAVLLNMEPEDTALVIKYSRSDNDMHVEVFKKSTGVKIKEMTAQEIKNILI